MSSLFCKECNKTLSGPAPYLEHIKSPKHIKRVESFRKLESRLGDGGEPSPLATNDPPSKSNLFECKVCKVFMNSLGSLETHNKGKKHLKALKLQEDLRRLDPNFEPGASGVPPNTNQEYATSSIPSPQRGRATPSAAATMVTGQPEHGQLPAPGSDLSCDCCGIVLFKNVEYKLQHLETEAHQKRRSSQPIEDNEEPASKKLKADAVVKLEPVAEVTPVVADENNCSSDNDSYGEQTVDTPEEQEEEEDIYDCNQDFLLHDSSNSD